MTTSMMLTMLQLLQRLLLLQLTINVRMWMFMTSKMLLQMMNMRMTPLVAMLAMMMMVVMMVMMTAMVIMIIMVACWCRRKSQLKLQYDYGT